MSFCDPQIISSVKQQNDAVCVFLLTTV